MVANEALERLNRALFSLNQRVRMCSADSQLMSKLSEKIEALTDELEPHCFEGATCSMGLDFSKILFSEQLPSRLEDLTPYSPIVGRLNPVSPEVNMWCEEDGAVRGRATMPVSYCGPPDSVHGGIVAALFDELLSMANIAHSGIGGMTAGLNIRYKSPTPINQPLELFAEVRSVEGRKTMTYGEIRCDGRVTSSAEAVFVVPKAYAADGLP